MYKKSVAVVNIWASSSRLQYVTIVRKRGRCTPLTPFHVCKKSHPHRLNCSLCLIHYRELSHSQTASCKQDKQVTLILWTVNEDATITFDRQSSTKHKFLVFSAFESFSFFCGTAQHDVQWDFRFCDVSGRTHFGTAPCVSRFYVHFDLYPILPYPLF